MHRSIQSDRIKQILSVSWEQKKINEWVLDVKKRCIVNLVSNHENNK